MWQQRAKRARTLASRYQASSEILTFYSGLAEWQGNAASNARTIEQLRDKFPELLDLVVRTGPAALASTARELQPAHFDQLIAGYWESQSPFSSLEFFGRALLQPYAAGLPAGLDCPWCGRAPQAGCLSPQGEGLAFELVCALCFRRRAFPRTRCAGCSESSEVKLATYSAPEFPHLRLQACDTCRSYLIIVDLSRDHAAVPEVDELAGLPLDLWAVERGYHKLQPNIAGI
jgi:FdhE protein